MKTEILNRKEEINWDKPQWVISDYLIVFTNGNNNKNTFEGTCLPCEQYPKGDYSNIWVKKFFEPIPVEGLTILLKND